MNKIIADIMDKRGLSLDVLQKWAKTTYTVNELELVADRIKEAMKNNEHITVVGDYDVDGIMATAIMSTIFSSYGYSDVTLRLPKRFSEGYGLSPVIIDEINEGLLITVDNGIAANEAVQKAKEKGLTVIVIDHHLKSMQGLPKADIIIDPNAIEGQAQWNGYCGAGLAYKLSEIMCDNTFKKRCLSMACIATIADSVPLLEDNRNIVVNGLKTLTMSDGTTAGLRALLEAKNLETYITEDDIGFIVAPCLNAPGRLLDDGAGLSLALVLYAGEKSITDKMVNTIIGLNEHRKQKTEETMLIIEKQIKDQSLDKHGVLVVRCDSCSEGLLGLCAGRLAEEYKMPTLVFGPFKNGFCKGSARTYSDFNLKAFLDTVAKELENKKAIRQYGGHSAAAGISVFEDGFNMFQECVYAQNINVPEIILTADIKCKNKEVNKYIVELKKYAPFGQDNPKLLFDISDFVCEPIRTEMYAVLKEKHLKVKSLFSEALWFDSAVAYEELGCPIEFDILGYLSENYFNGKTTPSIEIVDIFPKEAPKNDFLARLQLYSERR